MKLTKAVIAIGCALFLSCAAMLIGPAPASATPILYLSDGITTITVTGGPCGPISCVTYSGSVGANWFINVTTGISFSPTPHLDLNSINVSAGAGHLTIKLGDTDFQVGPTVFDVISSIGGTTSGSVTWNSGINTSNINPITGSCCDQTGPTHGPGLPPAFSASNADPYTATGPFALLLQVDIFHTGAGVSSFDYEGKVPAPASLLLLGLGLLSTVALRRRAA